MIRLHLTAVLTGCFFDMCFGEPAFLPHPVCGIGRLVGRLEIWFRKQFPSGRKEEQQAGVCLVLFVLFLTVGLSVLVLILARLISPYLVFVVESFLYFQLMAWHSLRSESMKVYDAFQNQNLEEARRAVSMIVGRDTKDLTKEEITKATVETIAENTSDGVIAPLFYMLFFGVPGAVFYKAVNTMDSMIGYQNETYLWFGRTAALLDDVCNFFPSRLSALLMIAAGWACRLLHTISGNPGPGPYRPAQGFYIWKRDRFNHKSPNSAQTEAVCAGTLQLQLAGNAYYFGKLHQKPTIGDNRRLITPEDVKRANHLMTLTYILALIPVLVILLFFI